MDIKNDQKVINEETLEGTVEELIYHSPTTDYAVILVSLSEKDPVCSAEKYHRSETKANQGYV